MSFVQPTPGANVAAALSKSLHGHWRLFLFEGILLVVLGLAAVVIPPLAGIATTIFLGWLLLIAGFAGLLSTFKAQQAPGFWWSLLSALVALVAGGMLLWSPVRGLVALTYVLIGYLVADGLLTIILAISHRRELSGRWEWILVNGVVDFILAGIIFAALPGAFAWALGLIIGIDLLFGGTSLIAMALSARKAG
jgi:uncharacterized membrane protein HdeD (DUF308 family)